jgi:hypothetical protein
VREVEPQHGCGDASEVEARWREGGRATVRAQRCERGGGTVA